MQCESKQARSGYTLLEMIIVMALMAIVASLIVGAAFTSAGSAKVKATQATIKKVDGFLQQRIEAFNRLEVLAAWDPNNPKNTNPGAPTPITLFPDPVLGTTPQNLVSGIPNPAGYQLAYLYGKMGMFRMYFPQSWAEMSAIGGLPGGPFPNVLSAIPKSINSATESAEVLYYFLTNGDVLGFSPDGVDGLPIADTDANGSPEIVDGWGQPLRFWRWPTRLVRPAGWTNASPPATPLPVENPIAAADLSNARILIPTLQLPGLAWQANTSYSQGQFVLPTAATGTDFRFIATNNGTSGGTEPMWVASTGQATSDGTITWRCQYNPAPQDLDPDDPQGFITTAIGNVLFSPSVFEGYFHTADTYHYPLVMSIGGDGVSGIYEPGDTANMGQLAAPVAGSANAIYDNISNLNSRSGGK